jgi:Zn-dependent protease with chaperone function
MGICRRTAWLCGILLVVVSEGSLLAAEPRYPHSLSRYDLSTRDELLYSHWLTPLIRDSSSSQWEWPRQFVKTVGGWAGAYVDGPKIMAATMEGCPVKGQPALQPIHDLVGDCARVLGVSPPSVVIRHHHEPFAYLVNVQNEPHLVLTSALLELFEKSPDQLRFHVGRELGRIKCDNLELRQVSFGLITVLSAIDLSVVPSQAQGMALTFPVGRFLTWSRESEISADRAGLFCCGSPEVANQALMRLMHGLKPDSTWIDPEHPGFEAEVIIEKFQRWERESVIVALRYLHSQSRVCPFVPERMAALKLFVKSGQYEQVLNRPASTNSPVITTIQGIDLAGLAKAPQTVAPYVKCYVRDQQVLITPTAKAGSAAHWQGFRTTLTEVAGEPVFFEVWNDGYLSDELLGGFVVYPFPVDASAPGDQVEQLHVVNILWDWKAPTEAEHAGVAKVALRAVLVPAKR